MVIISQSCISCNLCINYCPVGAINIVKGKLAVVDQAACVECGTCYRSKICPVNAIIYPELSYPRILRRFFSDPTTTKATGVPGRGTEEIKTNDVTDRFKIGEVGFCIEVGRPGVGTSLKEVEKITKTLSKYDVEYEEKNPTKHLLSNGKKGELKKEVLDEKALSLIIEFTVPENECPKILKALRKVSNDLDTVFSISLVGRIQVDGTIPVRKMIERLRISYRPNAKINLGLGRLLEGN